MPGHHGLDTLQLWVGEQLEECWSIAVFGVLMNALLLMIDDLTSTVHAGCVLVLLVCVRNYHRRPRPAFFNFSAGSEGYL